MHFFENKIEFLSGEFSKHSLKSGSFREIIQHGPKSVLQQKFNMCQTLLYNRNNEHGAKNGSFSRKTLFSSAFLYSPRLCLPICISATFFCPLLYRCLSHSPSLPFFLYLSLPLCSLTYLHYTLFLTYFLCLWI